MTNVELLHRDSGYSALRVYEDVSQQHLLVSHARAPVSQRSRLSALLFHPAAERTSRLPVAHRRSHAAPGALAQAHVLGMWSLRPQRTSTISAAIWTCSAV